MIPKAARSFVPAPVVLLGVIALVVIIGPILALGVRVPWSRMGEIFSDPAIREMLQLSLTAAVATCLLSTLLGVPLSLWISRMGAGAKLVRLLVLLPLALPPVVAGLALTAAVGRRGISAPLLDALGITLAFSFPGVILAHVFICLPFVVVAVDSALSQINEEIPASAAGVGLSPTRVIGSVILPTIFPAIMTGAGLAFARSLGEFGTTITFAGSMPGSTRTMPLGIYLERELDPARANLLGITLILLAVTALGLSALPQLLRRSYRPHALTLEPLDIPALRDLSRPRGGGPPVIIEQGGQEFSFPAGSTTGIIGPNGSGKTTLVSTIAGRLRGVGVRVGEQSMTHPRFVPAFQRNIVLLTQQPGLPRFSTVARAITMVTRDKVRTQALLEAAGLAGLSATPIPQLSGGQAAQVALLRALATRPKVLILDEPLAAIDAESTARWRQLLAASAPDRTTLLITHDALDIAALTSSLALLEQGKITHLAETGNLLALPPNDFLSRLAGLIRVPGRIESIEEDVITLRSGDLQITGVASPPGEGLGNKSSPMSFATIGQSAVAIMKPEAIVLSRRKAGATQTTSAKVKHRSNSAFSPGTSSLNAPEHGQDSARNRWPGTVVSINATVTGSATVVRVKVGAAIFEVPITRHSALALKLEQGTLVECTAKAMNVRIFLDFLEEETPLMCEDDGPNERV